MLWLIFGRRRTFSGNNPSVAYGNDDNRKAQGHCPESWFGHCRYAGAYHLRQRGIDGAYRSQSLGAVAVLRTRNGGVRVHIHAVAVAVGVREQCVPAHKRCENSQQQAGDNPVSGALRFHDAKLAKL